MKFTKPIENKRKVDYLIEAAWSKLKEDYDEQYHRYVDSFLGSGPDRRYFIGKQDSELDTLEIFPYLREDDVVRKFSSLLEETASEWDWRVVVHGQETAHVRKLKRKRGKFHKKMYRTDLSIYLLKKGKTGVKARGMERAAVEIKFIGSKNKRKLSNYDWIVRDIKKLNRLVRRETVGYDRGYFLCIDETWNARHTVERELPGLRGLGRLGVDIFYPEHVPSFGKVWGMNTDDYKINRLILLKHATVAKLEEFFWPPRAYVRKGQRYVSVCLKSKYAKHFKWLVFYNSKSGRGKSDTADVYFWPHRERFWDKTISIGQLGKADGIIKVADSIAPKIKREIKKHMR